MTRRVCLLLLVALSGLVQAQYSRTYNRTVFSSSVVPVARLRLECLNVFPSRSDIVPHGVVISGKVEDIKQDNDDSDDSYMASVMVRRVFYGPKNLRKARVTIAGFGSNPDWCHNNVKRGDTWVFVLQPITYPDYFRVSSSLLKTNLHNLEKIDGIIADEPFRKLTSVTELPCEKKYCPNNAICVEDKFSPDGTKCECLSFCKPNYAPVCGSNDETYNNECELRMKSCHMGKNYFVKSLSPCKPAYSHSPSSTSYRYSSSISTPSSVPSSSSRHSSPPASPYSPSYSYSRTYTSSSRGQSPAPSQPDRSLPDRSPDRTTSYTYSSSSRTQPSPQRERTYSRTQSTTVNRYQY